MLQNRLNVLPVLILQKRNCSCTIWNKASDKHFKYRLWKEPRDWRNLALIISNLPFRWKLIKSGRISQNMLAVLQFILLLRWNLAVTSIIVKMGQFSALNVPCMRQKRQINSVWVRFSARSLFYAMFSMSMLRTKQWLSSRVPRLLLKP